MTIILFEANSNYNNSHNGINSLFYFHLTLKVIHLLLLI